VNFAHGAFVLAGAWAAYGVVQVLGYGYWPAYLFGDNPIDIPISGAGVGLGGNAHAANEFIVIEGAGKVYGFAGMEKELATELYNFAGKN